MDTLLRVSAWILVAIVVIFLIILLVNGVIFMTAMATIFVFFTDVIAANQTYIYEMR